MTNQPCGDSISVPDTESVTATATATAIVPAQSAAKSRNPMPAYGSSP